MLGNLIIDQSDIPWDGVPSENVAREKEKQRISHIISAIGKMDVAWPPLRKMESGLSAISEQDAVLVDQDDAGGDIVPKLGVLVVASAVDAEEDAKKTAVPKQSISIQSMDSVDIADDLTREAEELLGITSSQEVATSSAPAKPKPKAFGEKAKPPPILTGSLPLGPRAKAKAEPKFQPKSILKSKVYDMPEEGKAEMPYIAPSAKGKGKKGVKGKGVAVVVPEKGKELQIGDKGELGVFKGFKGKGKVFKGDKGEVLLKGDKGEVIVLDKGKKGQLRETTKGMKPWQMKPGTKGKGDAADAAGKGELEEDAGGKGGELEEVGAKAKVAIVAPEGTGEHAAKAKPKAKFARSDSQMKGGGSTLNIEAAAKGKGEGAKAAPPNAATGKGGPQPAGAEGAAGEMKSSKGFSGKGKGKGKTKTKGGGGGAASAAKGSSAGGKSAEQAPFFAEAWHEAAPFEDTEILREGRHRSDTDSDLDAELADLMDEFGGSSSGDSSDPPAPPKPKPKPKPAKPKVKKKAAKAAVAKTGAPAPSVPKAGAVGPAVVGKTAPERVQSIVEDEEFTMGSLGLKTIQPSDWQDPSNKEGGAAISNRTESMDWGGASGHDASLAAEVLGLAGESPGSPRGGVRKNNDDSYTTRTT